MNFRRSILPITVLIVIILALSCRKGLNDFLSYDRTLKEITWAKDYYNDILIPEYGDLVERNMINGTNRSMMIKPNAKNNRKIPIWELAASKKNKAYTYVEMPIKYLKKITPQIYFGSAKVNPTPNTKILKSALDHLIIYKNANGTISQRIVSFIPSEAYLDRHNGDISTNSISKIDPDFEGYLMYKTWEGQYLFALLFRNGKPVSKIKIQPSKGVRKIQNGECEEIEIYEWFQDCYYVGDDPNPTRCDEPYSVYLTTVMVGDCGEPDPDVEDGCYDPGAFENGTCGELCGCSTDFPSFPDNPCGRIAALQGTQVFKNQLSGLKYRAKTDQYESIYYGTTNGSNTLIEGGGGLAVSPPSLNDLPTYSLNYMFHNHYSEPTELSIFSFDDLVAFSTYIGENRTSSVGGFVFGLVTSYGTTYALAIENYGQFQTFYNDYIKHNFNSMQLSVDLFNAVRPTNTNVQNEKAFLQILNGRLSGIALLKANSSQTIWKKRNLNQNGNLVDEDCND